MQINRERDALIIVDMQNDFAIERGSLYVSGGYQLVDPILEFAKEFDVVVATQDWHPSNHVNFHNPWPVHCVQGTWGAEITDHRIVDRAALIIRKGSNPNVDSYSAYRENADSAGKRRLTGLGGFLFERQIRRTYYVGLARDYCVKWSALDALGLDPHFVWDLTRPVDPANDDLTKTELFTVGVKIL